MTAKSRCKVLIYCFAIISQLTKTNLWNTNSGVGFKKNTEAQVNEGVGGDQISVEAHVKTRLQMCVYSSGSSLNQQLIKTTTQRTIGERTQIRSQYFGNTSRSATALPQSLLLLLRILLPILSCACVSALITERRDKWSTIMLFSSIRTALYVCMCVHIWFLF